MKNIFMRQVQTDSTRFYDFVMAVFRGITDFFGEMDIKGLENIPEEGGALIIANHLSYFDPIALGGILDKSGRNVKALAKSELFNNFALRWLLTNLGQVPVYRNSEKASEALTVAEQYLKAGETVAIYPEGTIPHDGVLQPFKTGAARLALKTNVPVIPIVQQGANRVIRSDVQELFKTAATAMIAQPTLRVLIGPPVILTGSADNKNDVRDANAKLEAVMRELMVQLENELWKEEKSVPLFLKEKAHVLRSKAIAQPIVLKAFLAKTVFTKVKLARI